MSSTLLEPSATEPPVAAPSGADPKRDVSAEPQAPDTQDGISLTINPVTITKLLLGVVAILSVMGTIADYLIFAVLGGREHKVSRLLNRIDLGFEPSVPAFYSSLALLAAAGLLAVITVGEHRRGGRNVWHWGVLSFLFAAMSLDEMVMLHELFVNTLRDTFDLRGVFYFAWVVPGLLTVLVVGVSYLGFLGRLDRRTRNLFLTAGFMFVGGALGMEMLEGLLADGHDPANELAFMSNPLFIGIQAVEETLEMLGVVVFIYGLLCYLQNHWGRVQLTLQTPRQPTV